MKQLAIVGSTASGKSDLALKIAIKNNGIILSLDSLSIYKEINIASAKPTKEELTKIIHFGVDEIYPNQNFNVIKFFNYYKKAKEFAQRNSKNLIIVGGSSFYLKMLIDGISDLPKPTDSIKEKVIDDLEQGYAILEKVDPLFIKKIKRSDKYRIEKALTILYTTGTVPSIWYKENERKPIVEDLPIFNIETNRDILLSRVTIRTKKMFQNKIIDEASYLEQKYGLKNPPLHSIGLKECYEYLNGKITKDRAKELIIIHTMQLAKRQRTFNNHQFKDIITMKLEYLEEKILNLVFK